MCHESARETINVCLHYQTSKPNEDKKFNGVRPVSKDERQNLHSKACSHSNPYNFHVFLATVAQSSQPTPPPHHKDHAHAHSYPQSTFATPPHSQPPSEPA